MYFLVPWIFLGTSCCLTHTLVPLGTFVLCYLSVPLYLYVPCVFVGALDILRYFLLPYTRLGTFRYIRCSSVRNGIRGYLYDPMGILCISCCTWVLLGVFFGAFKYLSVPFGRSSYLLLTLGTSLYYGYLVYLLLYLGTLGCIFWCF